MEPLQQQPDKPDGNAGAFIRVEHLSHRYPRTAFNALDDVDFEVTEGSVTGLLGPNGAGKSTLLGILTGIIRPVRGRVRVAGFDPADGGQLKTFSALVPQDYAFYPALTGRENLAYFAGIYRLTPQQWRQRLTWCSEVCQLDAMLDKRAAVYSGGLKRRLNLAIGLLNEPRILYLDEPTVGIDAESRQTIIDAIGTLRQRGTTMVYTSHYMEEVEALCDSVTVIDGGRVVAAGPMQRLLQRTDSSELQLTLADAPSPTVMTALEPWQARWSGRRAIANVSNGGDIVRMLTALGKAGVEPEQIHYGASRLEEVYLALLTQGTRS